MDKFGHNEIKSYSRHPERSEGSPESGSVPGSLRSFATLWMTYLGSYKNLKFLAELRGSSCLRELVRADLLREDSFDVTSDTQSPLSKYRREQLDIHYEKPAEKGPARFIFFKRKTQHSAQSSGEEPSCESPVL